MIGLIFGETDFPKYIYKKIKKRKNYLIIDLTKKKIFKSEKKSVTTVLPEPIPPVIPKTNMLIKY